MKKAAESGRKSQVVSRNEGRHDDVLFGVGMMAFGQEKMASRALPSTQVGECMSPGSCDLQGPEQVQRVTGTRTVGIDLHRLRAFGLGDETTLLQGFRCAV